MGDEHIGNPLDYEEGYFADLKRGAVHGLALHAEISILSHLFKRVCYLPCIQRQLGGYLICSYQDRWGKSHCVFYLGMGGKSLYSLSIEIEVRAYLP